MANVAVRSTSLHPQDTRVIKGLRAGSAPQDRARSVAQPLPAKRAHAKKSVPLATWLFHGTVSFLLVAGAVQALRATVEEAFHLANVRQQVPYAAHLHQSAQLRHQSLQGDIRSLKSPQGVEKLARDQMDMAAKDEILVRVF